MNLVYTAVRIIPTRRSEACETYKVGENGVKYIDCVKGNVIVTLDDGSKVQWGGGISYKLVMKWVEDDGNEC